MVSYYLDASALVKRYVRDESGVEIVDDILRPSPGKRVYTVAIGETEVIAAIVRRGRAGRGITAAAEEALRRCVAERGTVWRSLSITGDCVAAANGLARRHFLRGYDAVHLASALAAAQFLDTHSLSLTFVSADGRLNEAAGAEGLAVLDPNA